MKINYSIKNLIKCCYYKSIKANKYKQSYTKDSLNFDKNKH